MATEISSLFITISAKTSELTKGLKDVQTKMQGLSGKMKGFGTTLTGALSVPLAAIGAASLKAIQAASDLSETQSKVGVIFGESGKQIETFAATAATSLGQSKQQAMDAAATFATFGKSAGLSGTELVGFSTEFTTLASDLASFNNTSPEAAIDALGAALRGEAEPMRAYGVLMDDASLRAQALKMGLIATTKDALTPQQKVLAAHQLILAQTTLAQGDFQRTSEGVANQQRILKADLADTSAEFGKALLPIALQAVGIFRDHVVPAIKAVSEWFAKLSPGMQKSAIIIGLIVAAIGPLLIIAGVLATAIGALSLPIILVIAGIAALIAIGVLIWQNWDTIKTKAIEIWGIIEKFFKDTWQSIKDTFTNTGNAIAKFFTDLWEGIKTKAFNAWEGLKKLFLNYTAAGLVIKHWEKIKDFFSDMWDNIAAKVKSVWDGIAGTIKKAINNVIGLVNSFISRFNNIKVSIPRVDIPSVTIKGVTIGGGSIGGQSFGVPQIPSIPSLAIGTNRVNSDGLAMLHKNEMVMPADVASGGFSRGSGEVNLYIDGKKVSDIIGRHMVDKIRTKTGSAFG